MAQNSKTQVLDPALSEDEQRESFWLFGNCDLLRIEPSCFSASYFRPEKTASIMRYPNPKSMQMLPTTAECSSRLKKNNTRFAKPVHKVATASEYSKERCLRTITVPAHFAHLREL